MQGTVPEIALAERVTHPAPLRSPDRRPWASVFPILVGGAASGAVLALRYADLLSGLLATAVAVLVIVFAPGPRRVSDRFVVVFALGFGWLPLVGWLPTVGTKVDVPGLVLAIGVGITAVHQIRTRVGISRAVAAPTLPDLVGLIVGIAVALWWALPLWRLSLSGRLGFLFIGFDNNAHYGMFHSNLQLGDFGSRHLPSGALRANWDYPQGMHQAWAQLARLWAPQPPASAAWSLNAYLTMLILTTGAVVILGCMAISRLSRGRLYAALPAMAVIIALYGTGRFNFFNSFPNFDLATAAAAVGVTLLVRPTLSPNWNFFAVAGLGLVVAYNWYLLLIVVAPAIAIAALRARNALSGRARGLMTGAVVVIALVFALPTVLFFHHGPSTLTTTSGVWEPPWALVILSVVALFSFAVYRQSTDRDFATNLVVAAPAVLGGGAALLLVLYEISSTKVVGYYGQKYAAGIFAVCVLVFVSVVAIHIADSSLRRRFSTITIAVLCSVTTIGALQVDGYVGPDSRALGINNTDNLAAGLDLRRILTHQAHNSVAAEGLLAAVRIAQDQANRPENRAVHWWYVDPQPVYTHTMYASYAEWFVSLLGHTSEQALETAVGPFAQRLNAPMSLDATARVVMDHFGNPATGEFHLFVPLGLRNAMIKLDPAWSRPTVLWTIPTPRT